MLCLSFSSFFILGFHVFCCDISETVLVFYGKLYLHQSKKATLKSMLCGKLVNNFGYGTMVEYMRQSVVLSGVRISGILLLLSQASI
jgi:hypothetical protein